MQIIELIFAVPIVAIVLGIFSDIVKNMLKSKERQMELRLQASNAGNEDLTRQIQALRAEMAQQRDELAQLRDTATSYDLSIDNQLQQLERRMQFMEDKRIEAATNPPLDETIQRLGQTR